MKMCCANGQLQLENIVLCNKKEELIQIDLPGLKAAEAVIEEIKKNNPDVKIGIKKSWNLNGKTRNSVNMSTFLD